MYRWRYFLAFAVVMLGATVGLFVGRLESGDFTTIAMTGFSGLCAGGVGHKWTKAKGK